MGDVDTSMLWHACLGHLNESKLSLVSKAQDLYRHSLPQITRINFCDSCARGKLKQTPYSKHSSYRATTLLELVHTDLCGPISTPSLAGSRYFMPFVDDFSRMTFVYCLRHKHEALATF